MRGKEWLCCTTFSPNGRSPSSIYTKFTASFSTFAISTSVKWHLFASFDKLFALCWRKDSVRDCIALRSCASILNKKNRQWVDDSHWIDQVNYYPYHHKTNSLTIYKYLGFIILERRLEMTFTGREMFLL